MKPTYRIAVIAAGLAVAAWPVLRAADQPTSAQPTAPQTAGADNTAPDHPRHWQGDGKEDLKYLEWALDLNPQQIGQIDAIVKGSGPARKAIMADESLSREQKHAKMRELRKGMQAEIRAVLTPEQQKKFDAMPRPEWKGKDGGPAHKDHPANGEVPPPPPQGNDNTPPPPPADGSGT